MTMQLFHLQKGFLFVILSLLLLYWHYGVSFINVQIQSALPKRQKLPITENNQTHMFVEQVDGTQHRSWIISHLLKYC